MAHLSDAEVDRFYATVGSRVRRARAGRGMSQSALARKIGFARSSVANLEAGRQRIALHLLVQIAWALDCQPADVDTRCRRLRRRWMAQYWRSLPSTSTSFSGVCAPAVGQLVPDTER